MKRWRESHRDFSRRTYCSHECVPPGVPIEAREARRDVMDEKWEERERDIAGSLAVGLSPEGIASDCGIALSSLTRQCARRGRMDLHDALMIEGVARQAAWPHREGVAS